MRREIFNLGTERDSVPQFQKVISPSTLPALPFLPSSMPQLLRSRQGWVPDRLFRK